MSLTPIRKKRARPLYIEDAIHERRLSFIARHEEVLLKKIFFGYLSLGFFDGTDSLDLNAAAGLVGQHANTQGMSFHEAMFALCFVLDNPGYLFHWKRYDLDDYTPEV